MMKSNVIGKSSSFFYESYVKDSYLLNIFEISNKNVKYVFKEKYTV